MLSCGRTRRAAGDAAATRYDARRFFDVDLATNAREMLHACMMRLGLPAPSPWTHSEISRVGTALLGTNCQEDGLERNDQRYVKPSSNYCRRLTRHTSYCIKSEVRTIRLRMRLQQRLVLKEKGPPRLTTDHPLKFQVCFVAMQVTVIKSFLS